MKGKVGNGFFALKYNKKGMNIQRISIPKSVQDETRTHTTEWSLPPQSSASTNSATWTYQPGVGAKNGTRTRDPDLGKVVLYQLSYFRIWSFFSRIIISFFSWSEKRGSNPRPRPWQGRALPTELFSHILSAGWVPLPIFALQS